MRAGVGMLPNQKVGCTSGFASDNKQTQEDALYMRRPNPFEKGGQGGPERDLDPCRCLGCSSIWSGPVKEVFFELSFWPWYQYHPSGGEPCCIDMASQSQKVPLLYWVSSA